jgi:hypothetical protein
MKKVRVGLMIVFMGLLLMVPMASAYSISAGDYIYLTIGTGNAVNGGGAFNVDKVGDGQQGVLFDTFCLERNEDFYNGQELYVKSITAGAMAGGYSGAVNGSDQISSQTEYLYYQWAIGGGITHNDTNAVNLQLAIWSLEGEITLEHPLTLTIEAQTFIDYANNNAVNGSHYGVQVLNLYDLAGNNSQDQLVYVPEPATMLLFGLGLLGLAGVSRKMKK